eukprot:CAMPEP_0117525074 /NCGR_PEP_ID=MMETSP0784-20121206/35577_1 /TAXON_ID=39447 /ORGANISM="" /LENGTH=83 /DNA_ID=CAMNT_0005321249 /DNA_START=849 /DNA_END=1100 /DNA_ORIENTATION=-
MSFLQVLKTKVVDHPPDEHVRLKAFVLAPLPSRRRLHPTSPLRLGPTGIPRLGPKGPFAITSPALILTTTTRDAALVANALPG